MATDNSPPRIRIILTTAFSSLVILVALNYVFRSYFLMMTEEVEHAHLAKPEELLKLHEGEARNLTSSPLPIAQAMQELARGRTNEALKQRADVTPEQSPDLGPMVGWIRAQNPIYVERAAAESATPAPAPAAAGDGGAALAAGDAGASALAAGATDGGKPAPPAPGAPGKGPSTTQAPADAGTHH